MAVACNLMLALSSFLLGEACHCSLDLYARSCTLQLMLQLLVRLLGAVDTATSVFPLAFLFPFYFALLFG